MKIAPIGIINVGNPMEKLVDDVEEACMPTHWTGIAISAASAVAAAIAEGLRPSSTLSSMLKAARAAARLGEKRGNQLAYPSIDKRIDLALKLVRDRDPTKAAQILYANIGADISCMDSIPTAFGLLAASKGDPLNTIISAVNMGGDTDTIGSIAGGVAGAFKGSKNFPAELVETVDEVNHLELDSISAKLLSFAKVYR
jgi:ADP-ribosylglycohydrolase